MVEAAGVVGRAAMQSPVKQLACVGTVCPAIHLQASPAVFAGCELTAAHGLVARLMAGGPQWYKAQIRNSMSPSSEQAPAPLQRQPAPF